MTMVNLSEAAARNGASGDKQSKSVGELFADLTRDMSTLVRQEVQLAKTEMAQKAAAFGRNIVLLAVAAMFGMLALQVLCATAILALSLVVEAWLAALIVAGVLVLLAVLCALVAMRSFRKASLAPQQTMETIREDVRWAQHQMN
jgi:uncharacterized membrane protein YqjE